MAARKSTSRKKAASAGLRTNAKTRRTQSNRKPAYGSFAKLKWRHVPTPITEPKVTVRDGVTFVRHPWRLGDPPVSYIHCEVGRSKRVEYFGAPFVPNLLMLGYMPSHPLLSGSLMQQAVTMAAYQSDPPLDWLPIFHPMRRLPKPRHMSQEEIVDAWNRLPTESKAAIEKGIREAQARAEKSNRRRK